MKLTTKILVAGLAIVIHLPASQAQPWMKNSAPLERITQRKQVEEIGPGAQLVLVCKDSNTVTLIDIKDKKQAIDLCIQGKMITCHDCHKKYKVIWTHPPGKSQGPNTTMEIVNSKGEPCMFLARIK